MSNARLVIGLVMALGVAAMPSGAWAQQKIGYIDSEYILNRTPEYATVQQKINRLEQQWKQELKAKEKDVQELQQEFEARELLYTEEERKKKREEIQTAERELEQLRKRYFGPDGQLYQRQQELMRPIQERILTAVEEVATAEGYDYVFDKSGDFLFMFTRDQYDLSDRVLRELGVDVNSQASK